MGMACDVGDSAVTGTYQIPHSKPDSDFGVQADATGKTEAETPGLDPEETALILTFLSKGYAATKATFGNPDSDDDDMGDDDLSDEDRDTLHRRHLLSGVGKVHRVKQIHFDGPNGSKLDFTDDAGFSHRFRNESNRVKSLVTKHISIDELRAHFDRPIIDVAKDFGICITLMKKICRRNGIKRWPHRQIRSLSKSIASMEAAMLSAHGSERDKYRDQIVSLKMKRDSVIADPNKETSVRYKISPAPLTVSDGTTQNMAPSHNHVPSLNLRLSPRPIVQVNTDLSLQHSLPVTPTQKIEHLVVSTPSPSITNGLSKGGRWTSEEHLSFLEGIRLYGKDWRRVAQVVKTRSAVQTRTHAQKYLLKFAGRSFPFASDDALKNQVPGALGLQTVYPSAMSSMESVSSSAMNGKVSSNGVNLRDERLHNEVWSVEETPLKHGEAMARILNGSPQARDEPEEEPFENDMETSVLSPLVSCARSEVELESGLIQ